MMYSLNVLTHRSSLKGKTPLFSLFLSGTRVKGHASAAMARQTSLQGALREQASMAAFLSPERKSKGRASSASVFLLHTKGRAGMSSLKRQVRPQNRSPAPLIHLIAEAFATSFAYQMSEEFAALLEHESDLLAAMQRLVFLLLTQHKQE
jgi:hypothetical protein